MEGNLLQVSSTKIRELCNQNDIEQLKQVMGIDSIALYIIQHELFQDFKNEFNQLL